MSTKSTIANGDNFHLYHEALDEQFVYLELRKINFEATQDSVMIEIPVQIWKVIRQYAGVDLTEAQKTDQEIRDYVEKEVDCIDFYS